MYVVLIAIHTNGRDLEPGDVVSAAELGIYLPDLIAQKAVELEKPAAEEKETQNADR